MPVHPMKMSAPAPPMPVALAALLPDEDMVELSARTICHQGVHSSQTHEKRDRGSFTRGAPTPTTTTFSFDKYRTKLCHYYIVKKNCPFGSRCAFAHGEDQLNTPLPLPSTTFADHDQSNHSHSSIRNPHMASAAGALPPFPARDPPRRGEMDAPLSSSTRSTVSPNAAIVSVSMQDKEKESKACWGAAHSLLSVPNSTPSPLIDQSPNVTRVNSYDTSKNNNNNNNNTTAKSPQKSNGTNANAVSFMSNSNLSISLAPIPLSPSKSLPPPPSYSESTNTATQRYGHSAPFGWSHSTSAMRFFSSVSGSAGPSSFDAREDSFSNLSSPLEGSGRFRYEPYSPIGFSIVA